MNSLRCTNFLLMVIAVCLVYQCAKVDSRPAASALSDLKKLAYGPTSKQMATTKAPQAVRIVGTVNVNVTGCAPTLTVDWPNELDVNVTNTELPVSVDNILPIGVNVENTPLDVNIDR
jgi:hypothetical protein